MRIEPKVTSVSPYAPILIDKTGELPCPGHGDWAYVFPPLDPLLCRRVEFAKMSSQTSRFLKFGGAAALIVVSLAYLAYTGVKESKSYYVTIAELQGMGDNAYSKRLRVAGNVQPGSIKRSGTDVQFVLVENDKVLPVIYSSTEPPPDTFKDNSQALADGRIGRDGVFHANQLQAKCASKYAPQQPTATPSSSQPAKNVTQVQTPAAAGMSN